MYNSNMDDIYLKTSILLGNEKIIKLKQSRVAVFGLGGVGSFAVEALVRSGIGSIVLTDKDVFEESNLNRQLFALKSTLNQNKTTVACNRIKDINPACNADIHTCALTEHNVFDIIDNDTNFVIDAIDDVDGKIAIIKSCMHLNIPVISVMGTGNKTDLTKLKIADIYATNTCPLAKAVRTRCRKENIPSLPCVYSSEIPKITPSTPSSMIFVPAAAGLLAAQYTVNYLTNSDMI